MTHSATVAPLKFSLAQQIEEVERELKLRAEVYPRMVAAGKMRQSVADYHTERLQAVLRTLRWLDAHADAIKERADKAAPDLSEVA